MREHTKAQLQSITGRMFQVKKTNDIVIINFLVQCLCIHNIARGSLYYNFHVIPQVLNDYEDSTATESTYMKVWSQSVSAAQGTYYCLSMFAVTLP